VLTAAMAADDVPILAESLSMLGSIFSSGRQKTHTGTGAHGQSNFPVMILKMDDRKNQKNG
jgi:hypothetical protein